MKPNQYQIETPTKRSSSFWDIAKMIAFTAVGVLAAFNFLLWYVFTHAHPDWTEVGVWIVWFITMPVSLGLVNHYRKRIVSLKEEFREDRFDLQEENHRMREDMQRLTAIIAGKAFSPVEKEKPRIHVIGNETVITDERLSDEEVIQKLEAELPDTTLRTLRTRLEHYKKRKKVKFWILNKQKAWSKKGVPEDLTYSQARNRTGKAPHADPSPTVRWEV